MTRTQDINVTDLKPGDTFTGIDAKTWPFPFIVREVRPLPTGAAIVIAKHGWFGLIEPHHIIHRVA